MELPVAGNPQEPLASQAFMLVIGFGETINAMRLKLAAQEAQLQL